MMSGIFRVPKNYVMRNKNPPAMRGETTCDLAHTKWMCKYHIVFTPKYRRKIIYNQLKTDIRVQIIFVGFYGLIKKRHTLF